MARVRMAQLGTGHGHAAGKLRAMLDNPDVEVAGVYEPDTSRRTQLSREDATYACVRWFDDAQDMLGDATIVAIASSVGSTFLKPLPFRTTD